MSADSTDINWSEVQPLVPVFHLLANLWLTEVDTEFAELWNSSAVLIGEILDEPPVVLKSEDLPELETEYCRLFVGPKGHFPPVQSVWGTAKLESSATESMSRYIQELQHLHVDEVQCPDHIGEQLRCLAVLLENRPDASTGHTAESDIVLSEFVTAHLSWPGELMTGVLAANPAAVYRQLVLLTETLLADLQA